eukprot:scaffold267005_cov19-Tisochrysis_lutea.AAC.1
MLAPGMAEVITVEFSPTEYRYYHDSVRIHSEVGEGVAIKLHIYGKGYMHSEVWSNAPALITFAYIQVQGTGTMVAGQPHM